MTSCGPLDFRALERNPNGIRSCRELVLFVVVVVCVYSYFPEVRDCMAFSTKTLDQFFILHLVASWRYNF